MTADTLASDHNAQKSAADRAAAERLTLARHHLRQSLDATRDAVALMAACGDIAPAARLLASLAEGIQAVESIPLMRPPSPQSTPVLHAGQ